MAIEHAPVWSFPSIAFVNQFAWSAPLWLGRSARVRECLEHRPRRSLGNSFQPRSLCIDAVSHRASYSSPFISEIAPSRILSIGGPRDSGTTASGGVLHHSRCSSHDSQRSECSSLWPRSRRRCLPHRFECGVFVRISEYHTSCDGTDDVNGPSNGALC